MTERRFSATQIVSTLRLVAMGRSADEICALGGFPPETLRQWQRKYAGLSVDELLSLRRLEWQMHNSGSPEMPRIRECRPELILATARCVRCKPQPMHRADTRRAAAAWTCRLDCQGG